VWGFSGKTSVSEGGGPHGTKEMKMKGHSAQLLRKGMGYLQTPTICQILIGFGGELGRVYLLPPKPPPATLET